MDIAINMLDLASFEFREQLQRYGSKKPKTLKSGKQADLRLKERKITLTEIRTNNVKGFPLDKLLLKNVRHHYMLLIFLLTQSIYCKESA